MISDTLLAAETAIWRILNTIPHHLTKQEIEELRRVRRMIAMSRGELRG